MLRATMTRFGAMCGRDVSLKLGKQRYESLETLRKISTVFCVTRWNREQSTSTP